MINKNLLIALLPLTMTAPAFAADDNAFSWKGITFYGTVDAGLVYQSHGAPYSDSTYVGTASVIQNYSNHSVTSLTNNGLSQSQIGLKGDIPLISDFHAVFVVETDFNPLTGRISDGVDSLQSNNGKLNAQKSTSSDGARAGQIFNGQSWFGVNNQTFGQLTFGRHATLLSDAISTYDPQSRSYAFSVIGFSGVTAGGGDGQTTRVDNSVRYTYQTADKNNGFHVGGLWQANSSSSPGEGAQIDLGGAVAGFSLDALYAFKHDAISLGSLSAAQIKAGLPADSLTATVSNNTSWTLAAAYKINDLRISGGYEYITYSNPSGGLTLPFTTIGGYDVSIINNNAYPIDKVLQVYWIGGKYNFTKQLNLAVAYYRYNQNNYANGVVASAAACAPNTTLASVQGGGSGTLKGTAASTCSGALNAYSAALDYRFNQYFDVYGGVMFSQVSGGLASGYLYDSTTNVQTGVRLRF